VAEVQAVVGYAEAGTQRSSAKRTPFLLRGRTQEEEKEDEVNQAQKIKVRTGTASTSRRGGRYCGFVFASTFGDRGRGRLVTPLCLKSSERRQKSVGREGRGIVESRSTRGERLQTVMASKKFSTLLLGSKYFREKT